MKPLYLLDTDICIYIAKRHPPQVRARFEQLAPGQVIMSSITFGELSYGVSKSTQPSESMTRIRRMMQDLPVADVNRGVGLVYAEIRWVLAQAGLLIGTNDLWIAAHAKALGAILVTNNEREFRRIPGLKIENWAA